MTPAITAGTMYSKTSPRPIEPYAINSAISGSIFFRATAKTAFRPRRKVNPVRNAMEAPIAYPAAVGDNGAANVPTTSENDARTMSGWRSRRARKNPSSCSVNLDKAAAIFPIEWG